MNIAIILAGGSGTRVGAGMPKQFLEVLGKPVLAYTIEAFQAHPWIDAIEVVCIRSHLGQMEQIRKDCRLTKVRWVVEGGKTFQESVLHGVDGLEGKAADEDIVAVHFGASPFVEEDIITDAIRVCREKGNAISTTGFYLLAGRKDDGTKSSQWIDRDTIACMGTPHAFQYGFLRQLCREADASGLMETAELHTTTLMYRMGKTVYFSKGSQTNIKITNREDLDLFEGYLLMKERRKQNQLLHGSENRFARKERR